jgi:NitT/TauT family transport system substrate-binding protein
MAHASSSVKGLFCLGAFLAAGLWGGCGKGTPPVASNDAATAKLFPIKVQLDWFPEPEHGGLYQALAKGYFAKEGLDVTLLPGGSNVLVTQFVATGQADIGQSATTQVIQAVAGGLPVINIAAIFHRMPTGLMMHADNPITSFEQLNGKTIMARPEAVYIPYLKKKYHIDFTVIPQNFTSTQFLSDKDFIQEGFFIAEPYFLEQQGAKVKWLALWDSGYEPALTLFANTKFAEAHPEQLRAFLRAFIQGWKEYLEGDPTAGNDLIKKNNPKADDTFFKFERDQIIKNNLGKGDTSEGEDYGTLSLLKIKNEISIMEDLGLLPVGKVTLEHAATDAYLPTEADKTKE